MAACGMGSVSQANNAVDALVERGRLKRVKHRARAIELVPDALIYRLQWLEKENAELKARLGVAA